MWGFGFEGGKAAAAKKPSLCCILSNIILYYINQECFVFEGSAAPCLQSEEGRTIFGASKMSHLAFAAGVSGHKVKVKLWDSG